MRRYIGTIGTTTFTKMELTAIREAIGQIQPQDVGKKVFNVGHGIFQVENTEQRDRRLEEEKAQR